LDSDDQHIKKAAEGKLKEVLKYEKKWNKEQEKIEKKRKEDLKEAMEGEGSLFKKAQEAGYKGNYWDWLYEQKEENVSDLDMPFFKTINRDTPNREGVTIDIEAIKKGGFPTQEEGDAFRKWVHADAERLKKVDAAIAAKGFADDNLDLTGGFNNEYIIAALELVGDEYATFKR
jgi:hypothetical protein